MKKLLLITLIGLFSLKGNTQRSPQYDNLPPKYAIKTGDWMVPAGIGLILLSGTLFYVDSQPKDSKSYKHTQGLQFPCLAFGTVFLVEGRRLHKKYPPQYRRTIRRMERYKKHGNR